MEYKIPGLVSMLLIKTVVVVVMVIRGIAKHVKLNGVN